jgi:hypothetical protein
MPITSSDLAAARARLGLSEKQFASELGMPVDWYVDFEAGRAKLPKKEAEWVAYRLACADRDEALAKSGIPSCAWVEQWRREEPPADAKRQVHADHFRRIANHSPTCPTCQARARFVNEHFPNMPKPPMSGPMRIIGALTTWVQARPEWSRPAFAGALILAAMTMVRVPFLILRGIRQPSLLLVALSAVAAAALAGAGGGLIYSFVGRPARRVPVVGPYLAGIVAVAGYMACILGIIALAGEKVLEGGKVEGVVIFGLVTVLFGLIVGHMWFRPREVVRPR